MIPEHEYQAKVTAALAALGARKRGARRMVEILRRHQGVATGELARRSGVGNLSHAAAQIRDHLARYGLEIVAERPRTPIRNSFNEPSEQFLWRLRLLSHGDS